jgi:hypothetical protein
VNTSTTHVVENEKEKVMLLLKVQAGSRLYGYATDTSDDDYYEVHTDRFMIETRDLPRDARQTIVDGVDVTQMTLGSFMERAALGSHQALDAMFAASPQVDLISGLRESYRTGYEVVPAYERIITKFAVQATFRKQRHALRALFNLQDMMETGRYKPELSAERILFINESAKLPYPEFRALLMRISPIELSHALPEQAVPVK